MLLSHHGQYEYGSPKRPKTMEATILNYLDDLDSKINGIRTHIRKEPDNPSRWTSYHRLYDRYFFKENCLHAEEQDGYPEQLPPPAAPQPAAPAAPTAAPAAQPVASGGAGPSKPQGAPMPAGGEARKSFSNSPFAALKNDNPDPV